MNGYSAKEISNQQAVSGVQTNFPVTTEATVSAGGSLNGIIKVVAAGVAQTGTITPKLQTANGADWVDVKSGTAITANGIQYIRWNIEVAGDQAVLPLLNKLRLVITTTNAADRVLISSCELLQNL